MRDLGVSNNLDALRQCVGSLAGLSIVDIGSGDGVVRPLPGRSRRRW